MEVLSIKFCVASCHPTFLNFKPLDISEATTSQSFKRSCTIHTDQNHVIAALYGSEISRECPHGCVFLCCKRGCFFFLTKDHKIQKILEDINFILHLSYLSDILGVMNHCNYYLQKPGSNIVDFAIKLTTSGVGKVRLASHMRLLGSRNVAFHLFVKPWSHEASDSRERISPCDHLLATKNHSRE